MKIIHRYVLQETIPLFGLCLGVFTFLFMVNKIFTWLDLILNKGVPFWEALALYLNLIPFFMALTVPMAVMVSILLALGRLGSDLEVTALKSGGVHMGHLLTPVMIFGLAITLFMLFFNDRVLPSANYSFKQRYFKIVQQKANVAIRERVFIDTFAGYQFYIDRQKPDGELENVKIFSVPAPRSSLWTTAARTGRVTTDPESLQVSLLLNDGVINFIQPGKPDFFNRVYFKRQILRLNLENQLSRLENVSKDYMEMDLGELKKATRAASDDPVRTRRLRSEFQKRLALPFACLAVSWFAAPLGLMFRRRGFMAFTIGILLVFIYYLLFVLGEVASLKGTLAPVTGLWMANAAFLVLGWFLYRVASQERQAFVLTVRARKGTTA